MKLALRIISYILGTFTLIMVVGLIIASMYADASMLAGGIYAFIVLVYSILVLVYTYKK